MRMLIVEDEARLRLQLTRHFSELGWVVEEAADGAEALFLGQEHPYDLAIVDLGLPAMSGIELIRAWRANECEFPILVLTARSDWQDKVEALEVGADDYVTKPFYLEEIQARVNALQRRAAGRSHPLADYGAVCIDFRARQVLLDGEPLDLTSSKVRADGEDHNSWPSPSDTRAYSPDSGRLNRASSNCSGSCSA